MITDKKISILMPVYNGVEFLNDSIKTVIYQTYCSWELIIGVNGHEENSEVYIQAKKWEENDKRIKAIDLYTIKGKSNALNEMMKYIHTDWVSLLDVDDKWLPKKLESQIQYMSSYDIIGTKCKYFGDLNIVPSIPVGDLNIVDFLRVNPIINSSCLIKKELCYWDKQCDGVEDYDLWLKLWKQKKKFFNVDSIQVLHRIHKESAFNAKGNNLKVKDLIYKYSSV